MEETSFNQQLDDLVMHFLEDVEDALRERLEQEAGIQLLDHKFEIILTWNEAEQRLDLDIDAEIEFPPHEQEKIRQILEDILQEVTRDRENQLQHIIDQFKLANTDNNA